MKTSVKITAVAIALVAGLTGCASVPTISDSQSVAPSVTSSPTSSNLASNDPEQIGSTDDELQAMTDQEIAWEALMGADGEYAAAASYQAVIDEYGPVEPYTTILEAENRHINALIRQLESMGVDVPENPYLGKISAPADLTAAAEAWAEGEVLNVEMYDRLLAEVEGDNLTRVLTNLRRSSLESHLPSFQLAADNGGVLSADQMTSH